MSGRAAADGNERAWARELWAVGSSRERAPTHSHTQTNAHTSPPPNTHRQAPDVLASHVSASRMLGDIGSVLAVPSFVIVVTQGVVGSLPWNGLVGARGWVHVVGG